MKVSTAIDEAIKEVLGDVKIDTKTSLIELGVSSPAALSIKKKIEKKLDIKLDDTVLFEYPTIKKLTKYLKSKVDE